MTIRILPQQKQWSVINYREDLNWFYIYIGERGGSVVECRTPEREVRGSRPTAAVLCPWARHFTPRKYWLITQEAMAPSRYDWKIVDWDVKPQHNNIYITLAHGFINIQVIRSSWRDVLTNQYIKKSIKTYKSRFNTDEARWVLNTARPTLKGCNSWTLVGPTKNRANHLNWSF